MLTNAITFSIPQSHIYYNITKLSKDVDEKRLHLAAAKPGEPHPDPRVAVTDALLRLNVSPRHKGFPLVREAILMHPQNESRSMTKEVYPELTRLFDASQIQIEHAIRTAIHAAWEHRELRVWAQYFPLDPSGDVPRPTNAGFITRLSAALQIGRL